MWTTHWTPQLRRPALTSGLRVGVCVAPVGVERAAAEHERAERVVVRQHGERLQELAQTPVVASARQSLRGGTLGQLLRQRGQEKQPGREGGGQSGAQVIWGRRRADADGPAARRLSTVGAEVRDNE